MKLYHFPSPNPQKVTFALLELGLDCEKIPVDLTKGRSSRTGIPGRSIPQGGFGPRRRRRDADGVAGDPRLSRRQDRPPVAGFSCRTRASPAVALLPFAACHAGGR